MGFKLGKGNYWESEQISEMENLKLARVHPRGRIPIRRY